MAAKAALRAMPSSQDADDVTAFRAAITSYADAVRDFDDFTKSAGQSDQTGPRELLARFRTLREKIAKKEASQSDFNGVPINPKLRDMSPSFV